MADTQVGRHVEKRFTGYGAQLWQGKVLERVESSDQYLVRWHDGSETKMTTKAMDAADKAKVKTEQASVANAARVSDKKAGASSRKGHGSSKRVQSGPVDMDILNDDGDGRAATSSSSSSSSSAAAAAATSAKAAAGSSRGKAGTATGAKSSAKGGKSGKSGKSGVCVCVVTCCG